MINHFRTLLLNLPATDSPPHNEEFVPKDFQPSGLSAPANAVRTALFQREFPRDYMNFIATSLTKMVYGSRYGEYLNQLDKRVTVDVRTNSVESFSPFINHTAKERVFVTGTYLPVSSDGIFNDTWRARYVSSTEIEFTRQRDGVSETKLFTFSGDMSGKVELSGRNIFVQVVGATSVPFISFDINAGVPYFYDINVAIERLLQVDIGRIFLTKKYSSQMETFKNLYVMGSRSDIKLTGALLAYTFHMTERL